MKRFLIVHFLVLILFLPSCQPMEDLQGNIDDIQTGHFEPDVQVQTSEKLLESPCPPIEIVTDLSSISDFSDPLKMLQKNLISRVDMGNAQSTCQLSSNTATVDLKLAFKGVLGPKAKQKSSDKPFFSYPFFVAVTEPNGRIMAKEIFAASLSFGTDESEHAYYENLRQIIPIKSKKHAKRYKIMIGFQLSPEQLEFNRENMIPKDGKKKALKKETSKETN